MRDDPVFVKDDRDGIDAVPCDKIVIAVPGIICKDDVGIREIGGDICLG